MKKKWTTERKWELSKQEKSFEKLLSQNGYEIVGIKEYLSKTDYLIKKDGIELETSVIHSSSVNPKKLFDTFNKSFNIKVELENLRKQINKS